ncbi:MAG TPA: hypothetical protein VIL36_03005 [Acidimicrobiales bacterium]
MRQPGWWKASDGRWYPPAAARHPAARGEPALDPRPRRLAGAGPLWLVPLVPLTALGAVLVAGLADTTPTDRQVETLGPARDVGLPSASVAATLDSPAIAVAVPGPGPTTTTPPAVGPTAGEASATGPDPTFPAPGPDRTAGPPSPADDGDSGASAPPVGSGPTSPDTPPPGTSPGSPTQPTSPTASPPPTSAAPAPAPSTPTSTDDCMDGGWQHLVDDEGRPFANQGQCVSYLRRRG